MVGCRKKGGGLMLAPTHVLHEEAVCNWSSETVCQPDSRPSLVKCTHGCAHDRNDLIGYFSELCNNSKATFYDSCVCMCVCARRHVQVLFENSVHV